MAKRKKHINSDYEDDRKQYRKGSPRHVVQFEADMSEDQKRHTFATAEKLWKLGNQVRHTMSNRLGQMKRTKQYRKLMLDYGKCAEALSNLASDSDEYFVLSAEKKYLAEQLNKMQKQYGITWNDVQREMIRVSAKVDINSVFCVNEAKSVWQGVERILYADGKSLHFKKRGDLPCLRAKQFNRAIVIRNERNKKDDNDIGKLVFSADRIGKFGIAIPEDDLFLQEEANNILSFMKNADQMEHYAVYYHTVTGEYLDTYRPCYATLKCMEIRGRLRVFIQITVDGNAAPKRKKDGTFRHDFSAKGIVGCDIGTQSVAAVSDAAVMLDNLAERDHRSTKQYEAKERKLHRKMDRSRRAMNPDNYKADGTVKPRKERKPWVQSKTYKRTKTQLHELARKNADSRKYANRELANKVRAMGSELVTEPKNAKKLQRKARVSKVVVRADGTKRNTKRMRFGRSILHRSPGQFQAELKLKFGENHYHEVPTQYRASQYDHTADDYIKKELNDRIYVLWDGTKVQRDLYSAFLMSHPNDDYSSPSKATCDRAFSVFIVNMEALIAQIKASGYKICNSGI